MSLQSYVTNLPLSDHPVAQSAGRIVAKGAPAAAPQPGPSPPPPLPSNLQAAVDAGSLLSFVSGVSDSETRDVLFSVQLAQRAANAFCDRFAQTRAWYNKYNEVLEAVGWTTEQFAFAAHDQSKGDLEMNKAALDVITAIATTNQLAAITASISALKDLAANDGAIQIFDYNAAADLSGNFQIGAVQKSSDNGVLAMAVGAFYFRASEQRTKFLFFKWGRNEVNFWTAAQKMTFNIAIYDKLRTEVETKIGAKASDFIHDLKID